MNYKLVFLGSCGVGKSSIVRRFVKDVFDQHSDSTIGAAFSSKTINNIQLNMWDTAGQERFESLMPMYYRDTDIALVVFDVGEMHTLDKAIEWINKLYKELSKPIDQYNPIIVLIGNKIDMSRSSLDIINRAQEYSESRDIKLFTVSAKSGLGITKMFEEIVELRSSTDNRAIEVIEVIKNPKSKIDLDLNQESYINLGFCMGVVDYLNPMYLFYNSNGSPLTDDSSIN